MAALPLVVTRQVMGWLWPKEPGRFAIGEFPAWALDEGDGTLRYGFPLHEDDLGLKVAYHHRGPAVGPETVDRRITAEDEADFRPAVAKYLPAADGPLLAIRTCLYTNTPDSHFIIDRVPGSNRAFVAAGFSGHGFKFASVVGEILAARVRAFVQHADQQEQCASRNAVKEVDAEPQGRKPVAERQGRWTHIHGPVERAAE